MKNRNNPQTRSADHRRAPRPEEMPGLQRVKGLLENRIIRNERRLEEPERPKMKHHKLRIFQEELEDLLATVNAWMLFIERRRRG